MREKCKK